MLNTVRTLLCLWLTLAVALPWHVWALSPSPRLYQKTDAAAESFYLPAVAYNTAKGASLPEDAFGNLVFRSGTTSNAFLYCGEQYDQDLGLYYLRARYLNPDSGRFWSHDDFEGDPRAPASLHKYLYAESNPVTNFDPEGTQATVAEVGATTGTVGVTAKIVIPRAVSAYGRVLGRAACAAARIAQSGSVHHIFTNKNFRAGAKFSKAFKKIFKNAGLDLDDWYNKIQVPGHKGPHAEYNAEVLKIVLAKTTGLSPQTVEYAEAVVEAIGEIIDDVCNKKGRLFKLLVR